MPREAREITRADILSMADYAAVRSERQAAAAALRRRRRVAVGPFATFAFESYETMWTQVHEMLFIEGGGEDQIEGELAAYNPLVPRGRELVATLMLEIDDAVQLARALGATVLAGVGSPDKAEVARASGAHHVIDLSGEDLKDSLRDQVRKATGGGVDIVIDPVGGDVFDASLRALASGGRIVVVGFTSGRIPNLKTNYVLLKNISVTGLHMNDYFQRDPAGVRRVQEELFRLATDEKIDPQVMQAYPMERFAEALNVIRDRRVMGKIVLTTGHESV